MKLKFLRNTVACQTPVKIDQEMDVPADEARRLILMGRAVAVQEADAVAITPPADEAPASKPAKKKGS